MTDFKPGQKWISNAEPELGMGRVVELQDRQISVHFDMVDARRTYSRRDAPLTRVKFNTGDRLATLDGITITVTDVLETEGMFVYRGEYQGTETAVVETELDPNIRFSKPQDRLFTHQIDANAWFNLRYYTLERTSGLSQSRARGLIGPRVSLIPHQIYIASEVAHRFAPRVLLADEVGLGKTIEAGLIIHQQLLTGRAERVLIVVPHALTFQWFVEMIRRFNLQFVLLDEERCQQIESDNLPEDNENLEAPEEYNPFFAQQLMLCSIDLFTENPRRLEQALEGEWDLVVVDEAHHLHWTPEDTSLHYKVVELISRESSGLLLLTATPEQLGRAGHFARLRLLDPDRFHDYDTFLEEEHQYEAIAESANQLLDGNPAEKAAAREQIVRQLGADNGTSDAELVRALLDRHGTGRVLFRNVRSSVEGFPARSPKPAELQCPEAYKDSRSYYPELDTPRWTTFDPRVPWLIEQAESDPGRKFLVICAHTRVAIELEKSVKEASGIRTTLFHEDMDLIARDRAATYFAETHQGAQLLIASEIGSEGRNFQFASDLVLFDLPLGPDLLEQRIGRLDRIGQQNDVSIHIPYLEGMPQARLYRWYQEGMDCFASPNPVAQNLFDELFAEFENSELEEMISRTREMNDRRKASLEKGRDRLLELNSHRRDISRQLIEEIGEFEGGKQLEAYMERSFDMWGLESEPLDDRVQLVKPTERMVRHGAVSIETLDRYHYPELPEDGIRITYDRKTALSREDVAFFSWESPLVRQALDLVTSSITGNSAMIAIKHPHLPSGTLLLETLHVIECIAPAELMADRYLAPEVLRCVVTPNLENVSRSFPWQDLEEEKLDVPDSTLHKIIDSQINGLKQMVEASNAEAGKQLEQLRQDARKKMARSLDHEISRMEALHTVNPLVRPEELDHLKLTRQALETAIDQADVRLDAIRIIVAA